ncbi:hypothetical protein FEM48_Zijuj05G0017400 [Ziziphus jujuba var. spinosa]|uniref:Uncharacterized protein n=1 Tax=Ziziphus jujuba var. spinosa TaxID=714518 RepID=A0A978VC31_ZIZJJ|nr:hypothetical protein FEM48_Zijuj05G0017400 [Ziziphus jujuba var. spinosa]
MATPQLRVIIVDFMKDAADKRIPDLRIVMDELKELEKVGEVIVNRKRHTCTLVVREASPLREANLDGFVTYGVILDLFGDKKPGRLAQTSLYYELRERNRDLQLPLNRSEFSIRSLRPRMVRLHSC